MSAAAAYMAQTGVANFGAAFAQLDWLVLLKHSALLVTNCQLKLNS
jgi:hypothetical protein